ncbi:MAG: hypothetical protein KKA07_17145 [Bacteroidetes bacterium]|nr:hypothetical protein [Bacteroidota bacterium]
MECNNAGVLFFSKELNRVYEHTAITCVLFDGTERIEVLNRKEFNEDIITNIEETLRFILKELKVRYEMQAQARRKEIYESPA